MKLTSIRVRHFKAVEDSGTIKLGPLTAFVGYNGTGKSSIIEACEFFQNYALRGTESGGLGARDIHRRKGLKKDQQILDHMGSTELAANLFRATQTEEKLRRDKITGKDRANRTHFEVGAKVRKTIRELGGTMPESLPPAESIGKLEAKQEK